MTTEMTTIGFLMTVVLFLDIFSINLCQLTIKSMQQHNMTVNFSWLMDVSNDFIATVNICRPVAILHEYVQKVFT